MASFVLNLPFLVEDIDDFPSYYMVHWALARRGALLPSGSLFSFVVFLHFAWLQDWSSSHIAALELTKMTT